MSETPDTKTLKILYPIVFIVLLGEPVIYRVKEFDPIKINTFISFGAFFGKCLVSLFAAAFIGLLICFVLSAIIDSITPKIANAYKSSDTFSLITWVLISLVILCVLLYGVYLLYRPHLLPLT